MNELEMDGDVHNEADHIVLLGNATISTAATTEENPGDWVSLVWAWQ